MAYRKPLLLSIAAGLLALILNLFPVPIFTGVLFYFGGALSLAAGILIGPGYGFLAAIIGNIPVLPDWRHPFALLVFGLEALIVSWAVRRHSIRTVTADFVLRVSALLPWGMTVYRLGLASLNPEVWVGLVRLVLNGVIIAIIADLMISSSVFTGTKHRKFQGYLVYNFILVAVIPLLVLSVIHERAYTEKLRGEATFRLEEAATAIRQNIDDHLGLHYRAVISLADHLSSGPLTEQNVLPILKKERSVYDGFMGLVVIAPSGDVIAWEPDRLQTSLSDRATNP